MTKVAILKSRIDYLGGLEKNVIGLADAFQEAGCDVTLLTSGPLRSSYSKFHVIPVSKTSKISLKHHLLFDRGCAAWLKKFPQDIVFGTERNRSQSHYRAGSGVHAAYLQKRRIGETIWKQRSFFFNPMHRFLLSAEKKGFEDPDLKMIFVNSNMVREEILQYYSTPENKIRVIHNGVDLQNCSIAPKKTSSPFHFLFVGNGYRRKGIDFLLQALVHLPKNEWRLTVIGKEKNLSYFQQLAYRLKIHGSINFLGPQSDLEEFYREADSLVLPSLYDPFSNATLEALARGLFVTTTRFNGAYEILTQSTGTVIEKLDCPHSVSDALKLAMNHPKTLHSAEFIRNSVKGLEFSVQLGTIVKETLNSLN